MRCILYIVYMIYTYFFTFLNNAMKGKHLKDVLKIISPIPISVNHYTGIRAFFKSGKIVTTVYETAEAKAYKSKFKKIILEAIKEQSWDREANKTQHFYVDCVYYFDRVDKDSSNYDKCLLDTITDTQKVWVDDNVALVRVQAVYYDVENPRIEIEIKPVEYIGIFDNLIDLGNFKNKCFSCSRYLNGRCTILKKATEGRIQKGINKNNEGAYECTSFKQKKD